MTTTIDDEFAFLDVPAGGVDLEEGPDGSAIEIPISSTSLTTTPLPSVDSESNDKLLMNPVTGSLIDLTDIDSLIRGCVDCKTLLDDLRCFEETLRRTLGGFTQGEAKTRRVKGKTLQAKLEMADETWDQPVLKEAWESYPKIRDNYLKIGTISVKKVEFNKLANMATDDPAFKQFSGMLKAALREPTGAPRVSLEEPKQR